MIVKRKKGIVAKRGPMSTAQQVLYTYFERKKNWWKNCPVSLHFFMQDWRRLDFETSSPHYTCSPGWGLKVALWKPTCSCAVWVFSAHIWLLFETYSSGTSGPLQLDWGVRDRSREKGCKAKKDAKLKDRWERQSFTIQLITNLHKRFRGPI